MLTCRTTWSQAGWPSLIVCTAGVLCVGTSAENTRAACTVIHVSGSVALSGSFMTIPVSFLWPQSFLENNVVVFQPEDQVRSKNCSVATTKKVESEWNSIPMHLAPAVS